MENYWFNVETQALVNLAEYSAVNVVAGIYIFGGVVASTHTLQNTLYYFDRDQRIWVEETPNNTPPSARKNSILIEIDLRLFLMFGETSSGLTNEIWEYVRTTKIWTLRTPSGTFTPETRSLLTAIRVNFVIYFFGGFGDTSERIWSYNINLNRFDRYAAMAGEGRYGHGMIIRSGGFFQITRGYNGTVFKNNTIEWNSGTNRWATVSLSPTDPGALAYSGNMVVNSKLIMASGINSATTFNNNFYEYDPALNTWTILNSEAPSRLKAQLVTIPIFEGA